MLPVHPPPPLPERSTHGPPPPPARKVIKPKIVPLPLPIVGQPSGGGAGGGVASVISTPLTEHSVASPPAVLSTFTPTKSAGLHLPKAPVEALRYLSANCKKRGTIFAFFIWLVQCTYLRFTLRNLILDTTPFNIDMQLAKYIFERRITMVYPSYMSIQTMYIILYSPP